MTRSGNMKTMLFSGRPKPMNSRELAGKAAKELINYLGLSITQAGMASPNVSRPTIYRIIDGDPSVSDRPLQALAAVLHLPTNFFLLIIDNDRRGLRKLNLPVYAAEYLETLLASTSVTTTRRHTDREDLA